ncbi:hypothetical protein Tco_0571357 [Tanacetum coccineum]
MELRITFWTSDQRTLTTSFDKESTGSDGGDMCMYAINVPLPGYLLKPLTLKWLLSNTKLNDEDEQEDVYMCQLKVASMLDPSKQVYQVKEGSIWVKAISPKGRSDIVHATCLCAMAYQAKPTEKPSKEVKKRSFVHLRGTVNTGLWYSKDFLVWSDAPIIEEYESDSEDEYVSIPTKQQETPSFANQQVKTPRETVKNQFTHSQKPKVDKKELGYRFTVSACFICGSLNHLIRDCDFHEKRMARKAELNNGWNRKSSQREIRQTWNNVQRVNKQNQFVPSAVLTRTGKIPVNTARASGTKNISTARQSFNKQAVLTSTAMKVNTVKPIVNRVRTTNVFHKTHSPSSRPFKKTTVLSINFAKQKVNTVKDYPHRALKNKGIVDSGCSRHMTGNKAYLAEFQDFNGGPVAFGGSKGYITGKGKIKNGKLDFKDVYFVKEL